MVYVCVLLFFKSWISFFLKTNVQIKKDLFHFHKVWIPPPPHFTMLVICLIIENYIICVIHNLQQQHQPTNQAGKLSIQFHSSFNGAFCFVSAAITSDALAPFICVCICMCVSVRLINYTWIPPVSSWTYFACLCLCYVQTNGTASAIRLTIKNVQKSFSVITITKMLSEWSVLSLTNYTHLKYEQIRVCTEVYIYNIATMLLRSAVLFVWTAAAYFSSTSTSCHYFIFRVTLLLFYLFLFFFTLFVL